MFQSVGRLKSRMCSFWRSAGQAAVDVGQVVVGAARLALERARASTCWQTPSDRTPATAPRRPAPSPAATRCPARWRNSSSSLTCACATDDELRPARDAAPLRGARPRAGRRRSSRPATLRNSSCTSLQLAQRDRQQPVGAERDALFQLQLLLEPLRARAGTTPWPAARDRFRGSRCRP